MIAWGILEIILFFKIWGMTNDIRALKKDFFHEKTDESYYLMAKNLRKNLVLGNIEHVKKTLLTNFMDEIIKSYSKLPLQGYERDENGKDRLVSYEEKNLRTPIAPYVENLRKQFEKIGEPLPPYINNMATYGDFLNIFTKEDLMMENMTETMKGWGEKVKEFVKENKELLLIIGGTIAVIAAVCAVVGFLNRKK